MLILVVGAKGGVGTTSLAYHLAKGGKGIGLDLSDGQLAARLDRRTWSLAGLVFAGQSQRQSLVEKIIASRVSLVWTPECNLDPDKVWGIVRAIADRKLVIVDGGIAPTVDVDEWTDAVIVVTTDPDSESARVAQHHANKLRQRFSGAVVTPYSREVASILTEQLTATQV